MNEHAKLAMNDFKREPELVAAHIAVADGQRPRRQERRQGQPHPPDLQKVTGAVKSQGFAIDGDSQGRT